MVVELQSYGLRHLEGGRIVKLEGKGLYSVTECSSEPPLHVMVLGTDTLDEELHHWLLDAARRYEQR